MKDEILWCHICGCLYKFPVSEQEFYEKMEFIWPKRCPDCRRIKRELREKEMIK
jgi:hypothetical protein